MATGVGTATIDWGSFPGANEASVAVTGQGGITTTSHVEAWYMEETLGAKTAADHGYAAMITSLSCGDISNGVGFTIYGKSPEKLQGAFTIHWVWSN